MGLGIERKGIAMEIEQILKTPIGSKDEALSYLSALHEVGLLFHPDDRGADIVEQKTYQPVFSSKEARLYDARMEEVFQHVKDPYAAAMEIMGL